MRFGKARRITRRREFLTVQQRGRRLFAGEIVVVALPNDFGRARIGLTVSSKVGGAVVRNRIKRWLREAFRAQAAAWPPVDLVIIARSRATEMGIEGARRALTSARTALTAGRAG